MQTNFYVLDEDGNISSRPVTQKNVMLADSARDWLRTTVDSLFSDYCRIFEIHEGYGVQDFEIYDTTINITQDTSSMGCSDSKRHVLQAEWLWSEDRIALIQEAKNRKNNIQKADEEKERKRKIESLERQLEALKNK